MVLLNWLYGLLREAIVLSYDMAGQIIEAQFSSSWSFTPIAYENVPPIDLTAAGRPVLSEGSDPYIAIKLFFGASAAAEVGVGEDAIKRSWGNLAVDFYSKEDTGSSVNQTNIDNLTNIFEYTTISDIVFRDITILRPVTAEGWYITPTMLRFYFNR